MVLKKITDKWWLLESDDGIVKRTYFGRSKAEVVGRFKSHIRDMDLEKIRRTPKGVR